MTRTITIDGMEATNSRGAWRSCVTVALFLSLCALTACQSPRSVRAADRTKTASASRTFERNDGETPFLNIRIFYADAAVVSKLVEVQDDSAVRFRGLRRVGDGILSVGVRDGRGRRVVSYECGGHLFVTGTPGQPCQIVIRNLSSARLEILAGMDGKDAISGGVFKLSDHGQILLPLQTVVIGKAARGKPGTLRFGPGRSPAAGPVVEASVAPSDGSILLAVFIEKGALPWEGKIRTSGVTMPGKFPQPRHEPAPRSTEYR